MELDFRIADVPAKLTRGWFLGGMKLSTPAETLWLQHPLNLGTHFEFRLNRSWLCNIKGHEVRVEKTRPLLLAGVREQSYRVFVDGTLAASTKSL